MLIIRNKTKGAGEIDLDYDINNDIKNIVGESNSSSSGVAAIKETTEYKFAYNQVVTKIELEQLNKKLKVGTVFTDTFEYGGVKFTVKLECTNSKYTKLKPIPSEMLNSPAVTFSKEASYIYVNKFCITVTS